MSLILAVDLGGTKISAGLVDLNGKVKKVIKTETQASAGSKIVLANLYRLISQLITPQIRQIGIAMAGRIDFRKGIVGRSPNIPGFENFPLIAELKKEFKGKQFKIDNDAHCFVLGESTFGAGKKYRNAVGVTLGTGIGGGIIINRQLYRGANNSAGEFGHTTISSARIKCSCGKFGHLEAMASGRSIENMFLKLTNIKKTATEIEKMAKSGNKTAKQVYLSASYYLGLGLANILKALDPDIIILGGGLSRNQLLIAQALQETRKLVLYHPLKQTKIVKAKLAHPGLVGAALLFK